MIAGYNTMSKEKQKNVDTQGLGNFMGNMLFVMGGLSLAASLAHQLEFRALGSLFMFLHVPVIVYLLIRAQKYDGNNFDADGCMKTGAKRTIGIIVAVIVVFTVGLGGFFYISSRPAGYSIDNEVLNISGLYGQELPLAEITDIKLFEEMPSITFKSNGSGLGSMMKGQFTLAGYGRATLFVDLSQPPFIYVETEDRLFFLNAADRDSTLTLYQELVGAWEGQ